MRAFTSQDLFYHGRLVRPYPKPILSDQEILIATSRSRKKATTLPPTTYNQPKVPAPAAYGIKTKCEPLASEFLAVQEKAGSFSAIINVDIKDINPIIP